MPLFLSRTQHAVIHAPHRGAAQGLQVEDGDIDEEGQVPEAVSKVQGQFDLAVFRNGCPDLGKKCVDITLRATGRHVHALHLADLG